MADDLRFHPPPALIVDRRAALPPLAWLLDVSGPVARLTCGHSVVVWEDAFFEGAWDGEFAARDFDGAETVFGSGGRLTPEGWVLVPPSHMLEPVYLAEAPGGDGRITGAANSLPLLLAGTGARLLEEGEALSAQLWAFLNGIDAVPSRLSTSEGAVRICFFDNLVLGAPGFRRLRKPLPRPFADFAALRDLLVHTTRRVAANAADPARPRGYAMLASISSGFDSPAAAAIAREAGCRDAATFINGRGGDSDDGTPVAEALGLAIHRVPRPDSTHALAEAEPVFLGSGMQGEDIVYACWGDFLGGRILVSGFLGDFWRTSSEPNDEIRKTDGSGNGIGEFRLRTDFIHLPVPAIIARRSSDALRIARSEVMRPFAQAGSYSNPIARRIAEEAGVPGGVFGQKKNAVSILGFHDPRLFSPALADGVAARLAARSVLWRVGFALRRWRFRALLVLRYGGKAAAGRLPAPFDRTAEVANSRLFEWLRGQPARIAEHGDPYMGVVFDWACETMVARYRAELAAPP